MCVSAPRPLFSLLCSVARGLVLTVMCAYAHAHLRGPPGHPQAFIRVNEVSQVASTSFARGPPLPGSQRHRGLCATPQHLSSPQHAVTWHLCAWAHRGPLPWWRWLILCAQGSPPPGSLQRLPTPPLLQDFWPSGHVGVHFAPSGHATCCSLCGFGGHIGEQDTALPLGPLGHSTQCTWRGQEEERPQQAALETRHR